MSSCDPGADAFIEQHFHDCVYNVRDYIGFCLGLAAIIFWIIAQLPQYYRNYKTKSAEALSPWFLAQWLLGDTFNLIGALLQGQQLPTTVYTAMYFVIADMFMMMQFIYYGALQRRREAVLKLQARRRHHHHHHHHQRRPQQQQRSGSSSRREREALLGPDAAADGPPAPEQREQDRQQQDRQPQQQQASAWPSQQQQQQERRRVPHQQQGPHHGLEPAAAAASERAWQQGSSSRDLQQCGPASDDSDSCSDCDSSASGHSSSKGVKPLSRNGSPCRPCCDAAAVCVPGSCGAAAAAAAPGSTRGVHVPGLRLLGGVHWGGVRPVIAVAVLVTMGFVSLLPASSTRGMVPVSLPSTVHAGAQHQQQQQQGSSIHLSTPLLDGSSSSIGSSSSSSSSRPAGSSSSADADAVSRASNGWSRQKKKRAAAGAAAGPDDPASTPEHDWSFIVGTGLGYVASVLYLCSRVSQIHKNYSRKSSEGLALVMFIMAVCANLCTGTSIILRTFTWLELKEQLPWIIGSLGTISLDMVILWQSSAYSKLQHGAAVAAEGGAAGVGGDAAHGSGGHRRRHAAAPSDAEAAVLLGAPAV